jgi:hypothetical protein
LAHRKFGFFDISYGRYSCCSATSSSMSDKFVHCKIDLSMLRNVHNLMELTLADGIIVTKSFLEFLLLNPNLSILKFDSVEFDSDRPVTSEGNLLTFKRFHFHLKRRLQHSDNVSWPLSPG